jgi:hypothetical protein
MTEKAKKKKLLRVTAFPGPQANNYKNTSMRFALVAIQSGERKQVTNAFTCREQFCVGIRDADGVDFDRTRLLIVQDPNDFETFRDKLFTGKRMINAYEREAKWSPLSKITTVKHSAYPNAWLLTGPGEWMKTPQLMSTITFFLRLASVYGPFEADTVAQAEATMKRLLKESKEGKFQSKTSDLVSFLPHIWDSLKLVICEHQKIFGDVKPDDAWSCNPNASFGYASGILNFVTNKPDYSKQVVAARRRFEDLRKKK